jgi:N-acetylmuramoyl-L-alanine amidase
MTTPIFYKKFFFLLTLFITFSNLFSQKKFTIVLDAGHGGSDIGANRYYSDIGAVQEKNVTLGIVLKLGRMLEKTKIIKSSTPERLMNILP